MADHHTTPDQLDQWFHHTASEGQPQHEHGEKIDTGILFLVLVALSMSVVVITFGASVYADGRINSIKGELEANFKGAEPAMAYRASVLETQDQAMWIDRNAGTVRLSIDQAQHDVLEEYAR